MEKLHNHKILFSHFLPLLLQFSSLLLLSSAYTLPDKYFINCGSDSNATDGSGRIFVGDNNYDSYTFSPGQSRSVEVTNTSNDTSLYQTARIYQRPSSFKLDIAENGTYVVRLHFHVFSSPTNLSSALFNVSTSEFLLLSNFGVRNSSNSPVIKDFLLTINVKEFKIGFTPSQETSLAFVNAIEVFLAPKNFTNASRVIPAGSNTTYNGLSAQFLQIVHRINVGGGTLTPENDTLGRNWIPDDNFLVFRDAAKNSDTYTNRLNYQDGGADEYIAPDLVYKTAKELNTSYSNISNITWRFDVSKNARHLVRVHFCDIIGSTLNVIWFNLYIYSKFGKMINPYPTFLKEAAPFYFDFVVDSDNSGFMNISVGPLSDSPIKTAYLNGLEIMLIMNESGSVPTEIEQDKKHPFVIVGSVGGGVALICILLVVVVFGLKCRKAKTIETSDWPSRGGSERTGNASLNFNLELKIPFSEIQYATNNFDTKLMIGEGGFGKVYKGTLRDHRKVAVKRSEPGHGQGLPEFQTEIMVLSKIRHRHLVSLIGYCDERSEMILVYEFMEKGTLRDHLYGDSEGSSSQSELSWKQRLDICIGSARGLHYLHTGSVGGIIHRDVKSTNILLDENYVDKVADFGLSKSGPPDQTHVSTDVKGSFGYLDPEYFRCQKLTDKSDVYSFGVVLLEVLCARRAIDTSLPREQVNLAEWGKSWLKKGQQEKIIDPLLLGKINPNSLRKFGETAEKCLKDCAVDRPTMGDVQWDLEYVMQLQQTAVHREPHEDSTVVDASLPAVQRLPSHSIPVEEKDEAIVRNDGSDTTANEVFSQLRIDEAR